MAEYIEKSAAMRGIYHSSGTINAYLRVASIHAADVVEVVHGRWVSDEGDVLFHCSECETQISTSWDYDCDEMWNFCPHCGARMDGE